MKAAVLHRYDEKLEGEQFVSYEDVADPKITKPNDVIVRIGGAGVCRTDLHVVEGIWRDKSNVALLRMSRLTPTPASPPIVPPRKPQAICCPASTSSASAPAASAISASRC